MMAQYFGVLRVDLIYVSFLVSRLLRLCLDFWKKFACLLKRQILRFGEAGCLHLQDRIFYHSARHHIALQNAVTLISTTIRTSHLRFTSHTVYDAITVSLCFGHLKIF
jgi:hypothetical protein